MNSFKGPNYKTPNQLIRFPELALTQVQTGSLDGGPGKTCRVRSESVAGGGRVGEEACNCTPPTTTDTAATAQVLTGLPHRLGGSRGLAE